MAHYIAPQAEANLDEIWLYLARESGSTDIADRIIGQLTERFFLLSQHPYAGRTRDDLRVGLRSFPVGSYIIVYRVEGSDVRILHVLHGSRDIPALLHRRN